MSAASQAPAVPGRWSRIGALVYGIGCYLTFLVTILYAIGFIANILVPKSIDSGMSAPQIESLVVNTLLLGLFALQHSGMARLEFKRFWTCIVPEHLERSTYVLISSLLLGLIFWQWRPLPTPVWQVQASWAVLALGTIQGMGWTLLFVASFMIDHFDLFGLRQVYQYARGLPYLPPSFRTPWLYRVVRHPIMLGFLLALWATPTMTQGHLLFAALSTIYILIGIRLEERDLRRAFRGKYDEYCQQVSMVIPGLPRLRGK